MQQNKFIACKIVKYGYYDAYTKKINVLKFMLHRIILTIFLYFICSSAWAASALKDIRVEGAHRIAADTIKSYVGIPLGNTYSQADIDAAIKALFATKFFSDVKITGEDSVITVTVKERAVVKSIAFEGNDKVKSEELKREIGMSERDFFTESQLNSDIGRMLNLYQKQGRYKVKIIPKIINHEHNMLTVVYEIDEGPKAKIERINFLGNKKFSSYKLSRVISSSEDRWYKIFSSGGFYDKDRIAYDQELLKQFYMQEGFAAFEIISANVELSDRNSFLVTFSLNEGEMYNFGNITLNSEIPAFDQGKLMKIIKIRENERFNVAVLEAAVDNIVTTLGELGYAFVDVEYSINKDTADKKANVVFNISKTQKIYINNININNNTRTVDRVIRREMRVAEGDPYNISKIQRSRQRVQKLGFFSSVNFKNERTANPDKLDLNIEVEETSTGRINFGAGYNTEDGVMGMIELAEKNFLGKGQEVDLKVSRAERAVDGSFGFTEPYFLDMPVSAGFDVFSMSKDRLRESSYKVQSTGATLRFGYELSEYLYHALRYNLKRENVYDVTDDASHFVKAQQGKNIVSLVGHALTYDTLDDLLDPKKGYIWRLNQDVAGIGGQTYYFSNKIMASYYKPLYKDLVVLNLTGRAGNIVGWHSKKVKLSDKFFVGVDEIRGFHGIGPRDKTTNDSLGGDTYYALSTEIAFPLGLPDELGIRGVGFVDAASLFNVNMKKADKASIFHDADPRLSYGFGVVWNSVLGRLKIDYAIPVLKKDYDDKTHWRLSLGTNF